METEEYKLNMESRLTRVETTLDEIKDNHLAHISSDIREMKDSLNNVNVKLAYWSGGIVVAVWILEKYLK